MMKILLFLSMFTISACKTEDKNDYETISPVVEIPKIKTRMSDGNKRILFVGNNNMESYVRLHELFKALCVENDKDFEIEMINEVRVSLSEIYDKKNVYLKKILMEIILITSFYRKRYRSNLSHSMIIKLMQRI